VISNGACDAAGVGASGGGVHAEQQLHVPHGDAADGGTDRERAGARAGQRPQGQGHGARPAQDAGRGGPRRPRCLHWRRARRRHRQRHVAPPLRRAQAHAHKSWRAVGLDTRASFMHGHACVHA